MRVSYVLGTSSGGTVRHVRMLAGGLTRRGVTVDVYAPATTWAPGGPAGASGGPAGDGGGLRFAAVEIAGRPRPVRDVAAVRQLRALLASTGPDVVHAHGLRAGALAAFAVGRDTPGPGLVVTVHNAPPAAGPARAVYRMLEWIVARRAGLVLCVSRDLEARMRAAGARRVERAIVPAPPTPAPCPEAVAGLRAELGVTGGGARPPVVLVVARLAAQKGLGTLIDAAARWRDLIPSPLLVIAGTGPLHAALAGRASAAGVSVRFLGHRDDVPVLLAAADVVVLPSHWEGQPLIVQECLRAGRPLVASRVGGIPDLTRDDAALLVPPGDPGALSAAVLAVLGEPSLAARLCEAGLRRSRLLPSERDAIDAAMASYRGSSYRESSYRESGPG